MNLASLIDAHPAGDVALLSRRGVVTYGELREQVAGLRGGLAGLGLRPGDRVAIVCANNPWFVVSYLAVLSLGGVAVPLNPRSPSPELAAQLAVSTPRAAVVGPTGRAAFAGMARPAAPGLEHVVAPAGVELPGALVLEELRAADPVPVADRDPSDVAVLASTAGTSGLAKAAMLTHGNLRANLEQMQLLEERRIRSDDVSLAALPMFHIYGLNVVLGLSLAAGGAAVLVERFDAATTLESIVEAGCTVVAGAPPMWRAWAELPDAPADALARVRLAGTGAAKLPEEVRAAVAERFGVALTEGYGLTEASPVVTTAAASTTAPAGSIGRPLPGVELRLVDGDEDALLGDPGEIWVRGPNVFPGYWDDPDATAATLTADGWLRTGDVAVADEDGNLVLVDRLRDIVIVSGFNVFPAEVERALIDHPGVADVAVVGVEDHDTGEALKAWVVPAPGHVIEEDELIAFCGERVAPYKCPRTVVLTDELPQGVTGKVLRRAL